MCASTGFHDELVGDSNPSLFGNGRQNDTTEPSWCIDALWPAGREQRAPCKVAGLLSLTPVRVGWDRRASCRKAFDEYEEAVRREEEKQKERDVSLALPPRPPAFACASLDGTQVAPAQAAPPLHSDVGWTDCHPAWTLVPFLGMRLSTKSSKKLLRRSLLPIPQELKKKLFG